MTKQDAEKFIQSFVKLRESATDEHALESTAVYPMWQENRTYTTGERIRYNDVLYKVLQSHTSQSDWTPDNAVSLFAKVLVVDPEAVSEWEQPGSTNPYQTGDKVSHNGFTWVSIVDNNVWEPGVYGWDKV